MGSTKIQTNFSKINSTSSRDRSTIIPNTQLWNFLNSMENSIGDLPLFNSKLISLCPILSTPIRSLLSVVVISLLLLSKFPGFDMARSLVLVTFANIKSLILVFTQSAFTKIHSEALGLVVLVRDFIQSSIGASLQTEQILTIFACAELFKRIQSTPLELTIAAANNCFSSTSETDISQGLPSIFSLFNASAAPFLPTYYHRDFTLVLDLDETLGHYSQGKFLLRPGVHHFLSEMNKHYELVLFTAATRQYADWALESVDPCGLIMLRLYRQHTLNNYLKDLSLLGRDINKTIIIDNFAKCFERQPENGIEISSWVGDENDTKLMGLVKPLASLPYCEIKDLKQTISKLWLC